MLPLKLLSSLKLSIPAVIVALSCLGTAEAAPLSQDLAAFPNATTVSRLTVNPALKSAGGSDVQVIPFDAPVGGGAAPLRFLVQGGLHGNEQEASRFVLWEAARFAKGESPLNQLAEQHVAFDFMPFANPDGDRGNTRYNQRGVNLNRNFGVLWGMTQENPGKARFSEAETQAIRGLFAVRHYAAAVDVHGYINWIVTPSAPEVIKAYGYSMSKEREVDYQHWVDAVKSEASSLPGYLLKTGAILGDGGAFEDWAFWNQGAYAFCLEMDTPFRFAVAREGDKFVTGTQVDLFKRYEDFLYRSFAQAVALKRAVPAAALAGK